MQMSDSSSIASRSELCSTRCVPCEGGVSKMTVEDAMAQMHAVPRWELLSGPDRIRRMWVVRNFQAGMTFLKEVTNLAETQGHHPDLHLVSYRNVSVEIWTHAIQGLSLNDFILAAQIDELPIELKPI